MPNICACTCACVCVCTHVCRQMWMYACISTTCLIRPGTCNKYKVLIRYAIWAAAFIHYIAPSCYGPTNGNKNYVYTLSAEACASVHRKRTIKGRLVNLWSRLMSGPDLVTHRRATSGQKNSAAPPLILSCVNKPVAHIDVQIRKMHRVIEGRLHYSH